MKLAFLRKFVGKGFTKIWPFGKFYELILNVIRPEYVYVEGYKLYIPKKRYFLSDSLFLTGKFEPNQTECIKSLLNEGDTVLDIGANIGYYTLIMSKLVGKKGRVYAFEPEPRNLELLRKSLKINHINNVKLFPFALSNKNTKDNFFINKVNAGGHSLIKTSESERFIEVEVKKLDAILIKNKIKLIKIDTEGSEDNVLLGAKITIKKNKPIIILEYSEDRIKTPKVKDILNQGKPILFDIYDDIQENSIK